MDTPRWTSEPWSTVNINKAGLRSMTALLSMVERRLFYWLAKDVYTGSGEIVDAGAFLGGSARCFAAGLQQGSYRVPVAGRIHSYDLFRYRKSIKPGIVELQSHEPGQSFLSVYQDMLGTEYETYVTVYPGDILVRDWCGKDIEILMLDCSKAKVVGDKCMTMFFPYLRPGSVVVQQDYAVATRLHWIHSSMYLLRDYFDYSGVVSRGGSTVFTVKKQIPIDVINSTIEAIDEAPNDDLVVEASAYMSQYSKRLADSIVKCADRFKAKPF